MNSENKICEYCGEDRRDCCDGWITLSTKHKEYIFCDNSCLWKWNQEANKPIVRSKTKTNLTEKYIKGEPSIWHGKNEEPESDTVICFKNGRTFRKCDDWIMEIDGDSMAWNWATTNIDFEWANIIDLIEDYEEHQALKDFVQDIADIDTGAGADVFHLRHRARILLKGVDEDE